MTSPMGGRHRCPAPGCSTDVPNRIFACRKHWFALPADLRFALVATCAEPLTDPGRAAIVAEAVEFFRTTTTKGVPSP